MAEAADILPISDTDELGREVFSSREAKDARRDIILPKIFMGNEEDDSLSVDRLNHTSDEKMAQIGDRNSELRGPNRSFYGWATVTAEVASSDGRSVRETPQLENPYHADIDLNLATNVDRREQQNAHANALAAAASWRERP